MSHTENLERVNQLQSVAIEHTLGVFRIYVEISTISSTRVPQVNDELITPDARPLAASHFPYVSPVEAEFGRICSRRCNVRCRW